MVANAGFRVLIAKRSKIRNKGTRYQEKETEEVELISREITRRPQITRGLAVKAELGLNFSISFACVEK